MQRAAVTGRNRNHSFIMTNELSLLRRKHALTQTELGALVGISQTLMGRIETGDEKALDSLRLKSAFALQVVFGRKPGQLFQELFYQTEDATLARGTTLDEELRGQQSRAADHKRALLSDMVRRATNHPVSP